MLAGYLINTHPWGFVIIYSISVDSFLSFTLQDSNVLGTDDREGNIGREGKRGYMRGKMTHSGTYKNVRT